MKRAAAGKRRDTRRTRQCSQLVSESASSRSSREAHRPDLAPRRLDTRRRCVVSRIKIVRVPPWVPSETPDLWPVVMMSREELLEMCPTPESPVTVQPRCAELPIHSKETK